MSEADTLPYGPDDRFTAAELGTELAEKIDLNGIEVDPKSPPAGLKLCEDPGVLLNECMDIQRIHGWPPPHDNSFHPRACITPGGDFLVMFSAGLKHGSATHGIHDINDMVSYRSSDRGKTWQGPFLPWKVPYGHNSCSLLVPRGSKRIYVFCEEMSKEWYTPWASGGITMRWSDDDGRTWSPLKLIEPVNGRDYRGLTHMQMCETDAGTWLIGTYTVRINEGTEFAHNRRTDRQYLLRSEDQGETWQLLPDARPNGWFIEDYDVILEGRPINLGEGRVLFCTRAPGGHTYGFRSDDDGKTWSGPEAFPFVHPCSPPMVWHLSDGKTLLALHHNRYDPEHPKHDHSQRGELWFSLSGDEGRSWSESRFLLAGAAWPKGGCGAGLHVGTQNMAYDDLIADNGDIHLFIDFQFRQVLHVRFKESDLQSLPTRDEL